MPEDFMDEEVVQYHCISNACSCSDPQTMFILVCKKFIVPLDLLQHNKS